MKTYPVEILTPCFCAGADQTRAEIRAPSIRGQIRWWFRALGASPEQEKEVFGCVQEGARASSIVVRVANIKAGVPWTPPRLNPNSSESYVLYYAFASSDHARWTKNGNIPPGTSLDLQLLKRRDLPTVLEGKLSNAVEAFLRFGAVGLRADRGLGAIACAAFSGDFDAAAERLLLPGGFSWKWMEQRSTWESCIAYAGEVLKSDLRGRCKVKEHKCSPLGNSNPRHASAIRLRPVRETTGAYRLLLIESPHHRVLPEAARRPRPLILSIP